MNLSKVIISILFFVPFIACGQDLIVTTENDSLDCEIILVDPFGNISYNMENDKFGGFLKKDFILYYERNYFKTQRAEGNVHNALFYIEAEGVTGKYSLDGLSDFKIDDVDYTNEIETAYGGGLAINFFIKRKVKKPIVNFLIGVQADYYRFSSEPAEIDYFISIYDQDNTIDEPIPTSGAVELRGYAFEMGPTFTVATNNRFTTALTYSIKVNTYEMDGRFGLLQYLSKFTTLNNEFSLDQTIFPFKDIASLNLSAKYATGTYQSVSRALGVRFNDVSTKATFDERFRFNNLFIGASLRFFLR